MADLVGLQAQAPDVLGRLSQILQIRQQQQALAGQQAQVQQEQQTARQRAALAKHDFSQYMGADGTMDLNAMVNSPQLLADAGDQMLDVVQHAATFKQQQLAARQSLIGIRGDQRKAFGEMMAALRSDKDVAEDSDAGRQKVNQAMIQYGEMYGEDVLPVLGAYAPTLQKVPKGKMADALKSIGLQSMSADQIASAQKPQYVSTGGALSNVNPLAAGTPQDIPLTLSPGAQAVQGTDQLGNPIITYRDPRGNIIGQMNPTTGGGPASFGVGERKTFEDQAEKNFENVTANRAAASMAPQQLDQIDKALDLSKQVSTGAWAQKRASIESGIGSLIPGFQGMDDASKLQELDKFAERIATDASKVLGVNAKTDSERESIHKQNANIGYTPQAVQAVLKYAKAQTLAMQAKGDAQEAWLKSGGKVTGQHEFETAFRKAYDPRIFQYETMDEKEQSAFEKSLSPADRKTLREKTQALINMGAIPGG